MLVELNDKDSEFHIKSQILRSKIKSSLAAGKANHAIRKTQRLNYRSVIKNYERKVRVKEIKAGPLISKEELQKKELALEDAVEELELLNHLLEKMNKFIQANEKI